MYIVEQVHVIIVIIIENDENDEMLVKGDVIDVHLLSVKHEQFLDDVDDLEVHYMLEVEDEVDEVLIVYVAT